MSGPSLSTIVCAALARGQVFHYRSRFKVNLGSLCSHSQEVVTDAQLLHLGLPGLEAASLAAVLQPSVSGSEEGETDWWEEEEDDEDEQGLYPPVPAFTWAPDRGMAVHLVRIRCCLSVCATATTLLQALGCWVCCMHLSWPMALCCAHSCWDCMQHL